MGIGNKVADCIALFSLDLKNLKALSERHFPLESCLGNSEEILETLIT